MLPLYGSSILKLEHKTDNGTRSSDHLHQHLGEVQPAQQKACYIRQFDIDRTSGQNERRIKGKARPKLLFNLYYLRQISHYIW